MEQSQTSKTYKYLFWILLLFVTVAIFFFFRGGWHNRNIDEGINTIESYQEQDKAKQQIIDRLEADNNKLKARNVELMLEISNRTNNLTETKIKYVQVRDSIRLLPDDLQQRLFSKWLSETD